MDLAELAKEEIKENNERISEIEIELKNLLIPVDENDDNHNGIYIEIVIKLLNAFYDNKNIINGIVGGSFPSFVAWSMENNGFQMVKEDNIFNQTLI